MSSSSSSSRPVSPKSKSRFIPPDFSLKWTQPRVVRSEATRADGSVVICPPGCTDQSQAKDCDVNAIVDRFARTGILPGADLPRLYSDFSSVPDYQEALNRVIHAQSQFDSLDAHVRKRFANDPAQFLEFMSDERNAKEMVDLGLARIRQPSPASPVSKPAGGGTPPKEGDKS